MGGFFVKNFLSVKAGAGGPVAVLNQIAVILFQRDFLSKIELTGLAVAQNFDQIADLFVIQMKFLRFFMKNDSHMKPPNGYCGPRRSA